MPSDEDAEFLKLRAKAQKAISVLTENIGGREGIANLQAVFNAIDTDGNGVLDPEEFTTAMRSCFGDSMSQQDIDDTMALMDTDGDGEVSFEEFEALAKAELEVANLFGGGPDSELAADCTDQERELYDAMKQATIMAMHGGVRTTRTASVEYNVKLQGDAEMLQIENIVKRQELKEHPVVAKALKAWWSGIKTKTVAGMDKTAYVLLSTTLHSHLVDAVTKEHAIAEAEKDWESDKNSAIEMLDYGAFVDAMFELCDNWTHSMDPYEYADLIKSWATAHQQAERDFLPSALPKPTPKPAPVKKRQRATTSPAKKPEPVAPIDPPPKRPPAISPVLGPAGPSPPTVVRPRTVKTAAAVISEKAVEQIAAKKQAKAAKREADLKQKHGEARKKKPEAYIPSFKGEAQEDSGPPATAAAAANIRAALTSDGSSFASPGPLPKLTKTKATKQKLAQIGIVFNDPVIDAPAVPTAASPVEQAAICPPVSPVVQRSVDPRPEVRVPLNCDIPVRLPSPAADRDMQVPSPKCIPKFAQPPSPPPSPLPANVLQTSPLTPRRKLPSPVPVHTQAAPAFETAPAQGPVSALPVHVERHSPAPAPAPVSGAAPGPVSVPAPAPAPPRIPSPVPAPSPAAIPEGPALVPAPAPAASASFGPGQRASVPDPPTRTRTLASAAPAVGSTRERRTGPAEQSSISLGLVSHSKGRAKSSFTVKPRDDGLNFPLYPRQGLRAATQGPQLPGPRSPHDGSGDPAKLPGVPTGRQQALSAALSPLMRHPQRLPSPTPLDPARVSASAKGSKAAQRAAAPEEAQRQVREAKSNHDKQLQAQAADLYRSYMEFWKKHMVDVQVIGRMCPICRFRRFLNHHGLGEGDIPWPKELEWFQQCRCELCTKSAPKNLLKRLKSFSRFDLVTMAEKAFYAGQVKPARQREADQQGQTKTAGRRQTSSAVFFTIPNAQSASQAKPSSSASAPCSPANPRFASAPCGIFASELFTSPVHAPELSIPVQMRNSCSVPSHSRRTQLKPGGGGGDDDDEDDTGGGDGGGGDSNDGHGDNEVAAMPSVKPRRDGPHANARLASVSSTRPPNSGFDI
jgi:hypothetical protein